MKIVFLSRLYWPHVGGVERHIWHLSQELLKMKHEVVVITEQHDESLPLEEKVDGVVIYRIPYSALSSKMRIWNWMWQHRLIFSDVDVIHAHDVFWWYLPLRLVKFRQSAYTTFHGYEGSGFPTNGAKIHRKLVEFLSKKTICVGEFMTKWYKAKPDKVIYGAASIKATPPPGNNSIAYIGGLAEDVGILVYLQALAKMAWKIPIHIYGDGDLRSEAERFAKKYELPVVFHGWVKDIDEVYSKHSVIFTSRYLGILEAMQAGRLVVAVYNNEIKKDYLECHPAAEYMIIAGGAKELCKKLSKLDMNTSREMMRKAYVWSRKQTWNILANEYLDLWEKTKKDS